MALAAMFLFAALYMTLAGTVFAAQPPQNPIVLWVRALVALGAMVVALACGRRMNQVMAGALCVLYLALLLFVLSFPSNETRALFLGILVVVLIVVVALFLPPWFARLTTYVSMAVVVLVLIVRFPTRDVYLSSVMLIVLSFLLLGVFLRFRRRLENVSLTDPLCGVWNRRGLELVLAREIRAAERNDDPFVLVFIDLDGFKKINDERGHLEGDDVLRAFSDGLSAGVRGGDIVARVGGDEFVVLLPRTRTAIAEAMCERLRSRVTVCEWSYGLSEFRQGESVSDLIERSDTRMLEQKKLHRGASGRRDP